VYFVAYYVERDVGVYYAFVHTVHWEVSGALGLGKEMIRWHQIGVTWL
jgi:hypothetical protein